MSNNKGPSKRKARGSLTQRREDVEGKVHEDGGRDVGHAATGHQRLEEARTGSPGDPLEGAGSC